VCCLHPPVLTKQKKRAPRSPFVCWSQLKKQTGRFPLEINFGNSYQLMLNPEVGVWHELLSCSGIELILSDL